MILSVKRIKLNSLLNCISNSKTSYNKIERVCFNVFTHIKIYFNFLNTHYSCNQLFSQFLTNQNSINTFNI